MSIPLVQNNEKDSINTSIIAIKRQIERINMLLGLSNSEEIDTSVFATKDELQQAVTDLQPVDEVTADNMQSVTSNAVANALENYATKTQLNNFIKTKDVTIYFNSLSWNDYSAHGGGFYANSNLANYITGYTKMLTVIAVHWSQLDCRGCYVCLDSGGTQLSFLVETHPSGGWITVRFIYI